jgi:hypothetical protein
VRLIQDFYRTAAEPGGFWIDADEARKSLEIVQDVYDQSYPHRRDAGERRRERSTIA